MSSTLPTPGDNPGRVSRTAGMLLALMIGYVIGGLVVLAAMRRAL